MQIVLLSIITISVVVFVSTLKAQFGLGLTAYGRFSQAAAVGAAVASLLALYGCGDGPDLGETDSDAGATCSTGAEDSTGEPVCGPCEIDYINPSTAQCLCAGVLANPSYCPECDDPLPCAEPKR
jgi:hypothetical protein